jgi:hypothetical protein
MECGGSAPLLTQPTAATERSASTTQRNRPEIKPLREAKHVKNGHQQFMWIN